MENNRFLVLAFIILIIVLAGFLIWRFWAEKEIGISGWQMYSNNDRKYEFKYPGDATLQDLGYDLLGSIKVSFGENCFIGFDGGPFGFEDPEIQAESWQDEILVAGKIRERSFTKFLNKDMPDFASINLDYPQNPNYPYFLIYHSIELECLPTINQILSSLRFID